MQSISNDTMTICPLSWILSVYVEGIIMVLKELSGDFKQVDNFHVNTRYNVSSLYIVCLYRALFSLTIYAVDMIQVLLGGQ